MIVFSSDMFPDFSFLKTFFRKGGRQIFKIKVTFKRQYESIILLIWEFDECSLNKHTQSFAYNFIESVTILYLPNLIFRCWLIQELFTKSSVVWPQSPYVCQLEVTCVVCSVSLCLPTYTLIFFPTISYQLNGWKSLNQSLIDIFGLQMLLGRVSYIETLFVLGIILRIGDIAFNKMYIAKLICS